MHRQVVIVGAGISGLTCAYRLIQKGRDVLLLERAEHAGGVISSERLSGFLSEAGPNSFQNVPEIMDLVSGLGLDDEVVSAPASAPRYIYYDGALLDVPMGLPRLLSTRLLSFWDKLRILLEPFARARPQHEESIAEFVVRRFGRKALEVFAEPFVSGVYAGDVRRLAARGALPTLTGLEEEYGSVLKGFVKSRKRAQGRQPGRLCSFRGGLGTLPNALASRLNGILMANSEVIRLARLGTKDGPRFEITIRGPLGDRTVSADILVLAIPAFAAGNLLRPLSSRMAQVLDTIEYPPLGVVCLGYDEAVIPRALDGFGFLVPRGQGIRMLGCVWNSCLFPGRAPSGQACLTAFIGGATDHSIGALSDRDLVQTAKSELRAILDARADARTVSLHRYAQSIPQYTLGHHSRLNSVENQLQDLPNLFLIGNYFSGVSLGDCVRLATQVGDRVHTRIEAST